MRRTHGFDVRASLYPTRALGWCLVGGLALLTACSGNVKGGGDGENIDVDDGNPGDGPEAPPPVSQCKGDPSVGTGAWRRLTVRQYKNTVQDLLGFAPDTTGFVGDGRTGPFANNAILPPQETDVDSYASIAQSVAKKASENVTGLIKCDVAKVGEDQCVTQFIKDFASRAYRRPITADEEAGFMAVYSAGKADSFATGLALVVEAALQSPHFLYLVEPSKGADKGVRSLNGFELATRLSYLLTGTMPDVDLFAAARAGDLNKTDGITKAAKRLMDSPKFIGQVGNFATELIGVDAFTSDQAVSKPAAKYPTFDAALRQVMLDEPRKFVDYVMTKGDGSVEELLTASYVFPTGPLAKTYGNLKTDSDGRAEVTDGSRSGLLTLASTQAVHPLIASPRAAVNRGHMVRRDFLCEIVPPAPGEVDFSLPANAAELSAQELLRDHQTKPGCKGCHQLMDSIGFGFESYDLIGAARTKDERGNAILTDGEITGLEGGGKFNNAREMAQLLAKSPAVRECISTQWFRFALGRDPAEQDSCTQELLNEAMSKGRGDLRAGLMALVTSDSFRLKGEQ